MGIFALTRKTAIVQVGDTAVVLTEPSAMERLAYGEHFTGAASGEDIKPADMLRIDVFARIGLIADCMAYSLQGASKDEIKSEVMQLPPESLNALSTAALKLAGLWAEPGQDEAEKKSVTPDQSAP